MTSARPTAVVQAVPQAGASVAEHPGETGVGLPRKGVPSMVQRAVRVSMPVHRRAAGARTDATADRIGGVIGVVPRSGGVAAARDGGRVTTSAADGVGLAMTVMAVVRATTASPGATVIVVGMALALAGDLAVVGPVGDMASAGMTVMDVGGALVITMAGAGDSVPGVAGTAAEGLGRVSGVAGTMAEDDALLDGVAGFTGMAAVRVGAGATLPRTLGVVASAMGDIPCHPGLTTVAGAVPSRSRGVTAGAGDAAGNEDASLV